MRGREPRGGPPTVPAAALGRAREGGAEESGWAAAGSGDAVGPFGTSWRSPLSEEHHRGHEVEHKVSRLTPAWGCVTRPPLSLALCYTTDTSALGYNSYLHRAAEHMLIE
jgi:hypothetical protein